MNRFAPRDLLYAFGRLNFRRREECATIIRWLDAGPGERILDIGSGDGAYDNKIARSGARVDGIDIHKDRLAAAGRWFHGEGTKFHFMDASRLDFPDASFDKAMSLCVMEHLEDDELVMRNVARVLKPGGLFVFSADSLSNEAIRPEERDRHRSKYAVITFYTIDKVREKLSRSGFEVAQYRYILSSSRDLRYIRLSWKLDDLPARLGLVKMLGYAVLGTARGIGSFLKPGSHAKAAESGLTLLVRAVKRPGSPK